MKTKLALLRESLGISQSKLSMISQVSVAQISRIERGDALIGNVTLSNAVKLSQALGVHAEDLLDNAEDDSSHDM